LPCESRFAALQRRRLIAAFPEMPVTLPELGVGSFKAADRVVTAAGDAVVKELRRCPRTLLASHGFRGP
jgi:hypothetical protein